VPREWQCQQPGERTEQREIKHDRRRGFGVGEPSRLDGGAGVAERRQEREQRADRRPGRCHLRHVEIGRQHDDDAAKADRHRSPAVGLHTLFEDQRGERHRDERCGEGNRGGVDERQPRQRREAQEHRADADEAATKVTRQTMGAHSGHESAPRRVNDHHRQERQDTAEEHHLPDRNRVAEAANERRHQGEQQQRCELESDSLGDVHRAGSAPPEGGNDWGCAKSLRRNRTEV